MKEILKPMQTNKINMPKITKLPNRLSIMVTECQDLKKLYLVLYIYGENWRNITNHMLCISTQVYKRMEEQKIGFKRWIKWRSV